jgi:hypothetical protein
MADSNAGLIILSCRLAPKVLPKKIALVPERRSLKGE